MIDAPAALPALKAAGDPSKAEGMAAYHKAERVYLGVAVPEIDALCKDWRSEIGADLNQRVALADGLWASDVHEARVAAGRLLTQARIPNDAAVWRTVAGWVPDFDAWAISDHAASAGSRRIAADPTRLDEVEGWTRDENKWVRRAALVFSLPFAKGRHPKPSELEARKRVLGWAAAYVPDRDWFIQKAVSWWIRTLSSHDPDRARAFLAAHGEAMKPFARRDASRKLPPR